MPNRGSGLVKAHMRYKKVKPISLIISTPLIPVPGVRGRLLWISAVVK